MNWQSKLNTKLGKALQAGLISVHEWRQVNEFIEIQQQSLNNACFKNNCDYDYLENEYIANATISKVVYQSV